MEDFADMMTALRHIEWRASFSVRGCSFASTDRLGDGEVKKHQDIIGVHGSV